MNKPYTTVDQLFGANLKNVFFANFGCKFLAFLAPKMLKMNIPTSLWSEQRPNAGQNIQYIHNESQTCYLGPCKFEVLTPLIIAQYIKKTKLPLGSFPSFASLIVFTRCVSWNGCPVFTTKMSFVPPGWQLVCLISKPTFLCHFTMDVIDGDLRQYFFCFSIFLCTVYVIDKVIYINIYCVLYVFSTFWTLPIFS